MERKKKKSITKFIIEIVDIDEDTIEFYMWTERDGGLNKLPGKFGLIEFEDLCLRLVAHTYINPKRVVQFSKQQLGLLDLLRLNVQDSSSFKDSKPYKIGLILGGKDVNS
jgi:hypothetical protein